MTNKFKTLGTAVWEALQGCTQSGRNDCLTGEPPTDCDDYTCTWNKEYKMWGHFEFEPNAKFTRTKLDRVMDYFTEANSTKPNRWEIFHLACTNNTVSVESLKDMAKMKGQTFNELIDELHAHITPDPEE